MNQHAMTHNVPGSLPPSCLCRNSPPLEPKMWLQRLHRPHPPRASALLSPDPPSFPSRPWKNLHNQTLQFGSSGCPCSSSPGGGRNSMPCTEIPGLLLTCCNGDCAEAGATPPTPGPCWAPPPHPPSCGCTLTPVPQLPELDVEVVLEPTLLIPESLPLLALPAPLGDCSPASPPLLPPTAPSLWGSAGSPWLVWLPTLLDS